MMSTEQLQDVEELKQGSGVAPNRVLFICYDFPPRRTSAVYRHVGIMKYLPMLGWKPTILTILPEATDVQDEGLLEGLDPRIEIVRTSRNDITRWEGKAEQTIKSSGGLSPAKSDGDESLLNRLIRRVGAFIRSLVYFPDDTVGWTLPGLREAIKLHRKNTFDIVYTSSPPRSAPLIGLGLKLLFGIPWVAEFRDPWYPPKRPLRRRFERMLQKFILRKADAIVLISDGLAAELQSSFGIPATKLHVVPNGYDESEFTPDAGPVAIFDSTKFNISHFGTVYKGLCGKFFHALKEVVEETPVYRQQVRINIIGFPDDPELAEWSRSTELGEMIKFHEFMPQRDALKAMQASECLLLFLGSSAMSRLSGLGKIYWYLRVGRPILAIAPEGGTKDLIEQAHAGWAAAPEDTESMKRALREVISAGHQPVPTQPIDPEFVEQFRYDRLSKNVASVLAKITQVK
jgi:glycosyltransferase involved in cell wall biosynthesis